MSNKTKRMTKIFTGVLWLVLMMGCAFQADESQLETVPPANSETPNSVQIPTHQEKYQAPPWVVISEMDFGQPSISTMFRDQNFGITTDLGGGIYITENGGQTWDFRQDAALSRVALEIVEENRIWHIGWHGPVIHSTDSGYTWETMTSVPHNGHTEYVSFIDDHTGWAATSELQVYWVTDDGAQSWINYSLPEGMGTVAALHLRTESDAYFLDLTGNLFVTTDRGQTWKVHSIGLGDGWQIPELNHSAAMRFTDADHGLIALNVIGEGRGRTFALRTTDGGETWVKETLPVEMGMFHLTRDGYYLTHVDLLNHGKFTLLRATRLTMGESIPINRDLRVRQIQEGSFVFSHAFPWAANSLAVVIGDHLVLVDTPYTPEATQEMLAWLEDQVGPKQIIAINTHFHLDNLGGNSYLIEQGIPVYGSNLTEALLDERGQDSLDQTVAFLQAEQDSRFAEAFKSLSLTPPSELFELREGLNLTFGDESVQVYYPGPAHTPDNVVVYFPDRHLLFGGCLIIGRDAIGNTADADLANWPEAVRNLEPFEFDILVPGHGERLDPELLNHTLELLQNP